MLALWIRLVFDSRRKRLQYICYKCYIILFNKHTTLFNSYIYFSLSAHRIGIYMLKN